MSSLVEHLGESNVKGAVMGDEQSRIDDLIGAFENVLGVLLAAAILSAVGTAVWMLTL